MTMNPERERLLDALLSADRKAPMASDGLGGPVFWYAQMGEGAFVRHPGFPDRSNVDVRDRTDLTALMKHGYIQVRDWHDDHRSFTFELTEKALVYRMGA